MSFERSWKSRANGTIVADAEREETPAGEVIDLFFPEDRDFRLLHT